MSAFLAYGVIAFAQDDFSQEEYQNLPRVCVAQKVIHAALRPKIVPDAERRQWEARLGLEDYSHFHHYCWALIHLRRASAAGTRQDQEYRYRRAVADFGYVQRNASSEFPLMPEVNFRKGQTHLLLGENEAAVKEFAEAIQLKPDYTPPYAALVDFYMDVGDVVGAERVLNAGLTHSPRSKMLLQKKIDLETFRSKK